MNTTSILLIANETLGGRALRQLVQERLDSAPCRFHVVVPAVRLEGVMQRSIDAYGGGRDEIERRADRTAAEPRLAEELDWLRSLGAQADGEIGDADPLVAVETVLRERDFDEIVLSTLPPGMSHWLHLDLPHRMERALGRSVTHVEGPSAP
ncbi:MAG: hypothetical protein KDB02_02595 [Acidimicrobiales bacterium]|nr:hypothetical protein [Acidimicrobiales bacterium]